MNKTSDVLSPKKYYVYVLLSVKDHKLYIGFTTDLIQRIKEHTNGNVTATKNRLPLKLLHYEYFINQEDAKARERFLKSGFGREQLKQALKRTLIQYEYKFLKSDPTRRYIIASTFRVK